MTDPIPTYYWGDTGMERDRAGNGPYVLAADAEAHEAAAVAAARAEGWEEGHLWRIGRPEYCYHYKQGQRDERARYNQPSMYDEGRWDERARIRAGVKALAWWHLPDGLPKMSRDAVLAVIDAAPQDGE